MKIKTIGELKKAIEGFQDNDIVVVEIHDGIRHEDLYQFSIDEIDGITSIDGKEISEIRFCI